MMTLDTDLQQITEAFLSQRLYAPRSITISDELLSAIRNEYIRINGEGITDEKRIASAIEYAVKSIGMSIKKSDKWQKVVDKNAKTIKSKINLNKELPHELSDDLGLKKP